MNSLTVSLFRFQMDKCKKRFLPEERELQSPNQTAIPLLIGNTNGECFLSEHISQAVLEVLCQGKKDLPTAVIVRAMYRMKPQHLHLDLIPPTFVAPPLLFRDAPGTLQITILLTAHIFFFLCEFRLTENFQGWKGNSTASIKHLLLLLMHQKLCTPIKSCTGPLR